MNSEIELMKRRAEAFLKNAEDLISKGFYDLAAFNIHHFVELYLLTGDYPKTHSIKKLLRDFGAVLEASEEIRKFVEEQIDRIGNLEVAYITSRYLPVEFERREVENMFETAKKIRKVVDELCLKRG